MLVDAFTFQSLDDREARCLDGSQAGFYIRHGRRDRWLLFLEGGADSWNLLVPHSGCQPGNVSTN